MVLLIFLLLGAVVSVSSDCTQDVEAYKKAVATREPWAMQMLDSSSTFPDGLRYAAAPCFGHFEQCLAAPTAPRYCMVSYEMDSVPSSSWTRLVTRREETLPASLVQMAVCAPASCDANGAMEVAAFNLGQLLDKLGGRLKPSFCFSAEPFDAKAIAFAAISAFSVLLVIGASFTKKVPWLSARQNIRDLFRASPPGAIHCVHAIRFLSICWVMLGHKIYTHVLVSPPPLSLALQPTWPAAIFLNGYISVDTFFLMSALLCARAVAKARRLPLLPFYLLRFLRVFPPLAAVVFFTACFSSVVARGPFWQLYVQNEALYCRQRWWSTLIFLNNYIDGKTSSCLSYSWYLSVDMQLMWLSPLVMIPLLKCPKKGLPLLFALLGATVIAIFTLTMVYDLPWTMSVLTSGEKIVRYWDLIYTNTPLRAQPFLIGILLGFYVERPVGRLSNGMVAAGWATCLVATFGVVFSMILDLRGPLANSTVAAAFYSSVHRIIWSCSLAWIIFACHKGYGGPINKILSLRFWVPLSRLTYCTFLINYTVMTMLVGVAKADSQFSLYRLIHEYFGDVVVILAIALVLYIVVEAPASNLLKILANRWK